MWAGMGTPAQDTLRKQLAEIGPATYLAVGAAFDFIGGTKKQASKLPQRSGWSGAIGWQPNRDVCGICDDRQDRMSSTAASPTRSNSQSQSRSGNR